MEHVHFACVPDNTGWTKGIDRVEYKTLNTLVLRHRLGVPALQVTEGQKEEDEGKWAATKGMQYSARGRKLAFSSKQLVMFIWPLVAWMALIILTFGLSYMFIGSSIPRLDSVNAGSRVHAYSKSSSLA